MASSKTARTVRCSVALLSKYTGLWETLRVMLTERKALQLRAEWRAKGYQCEAYRGEVGGEKLPSCDCGCPQCTGCDVDAPCRR